MCEANSEKLREKNEGLFSYIGRMRVGLGGKISLCEGKRALLLRWGTGQKTFFHLGENFARSRPAQTSFSRAVLPQLDYSTAPSCWIWIRPERPGDFSPPCDCNYLQICERSYEIQDVLLSLMHVIYVGTDRGAWKGLDLESRLIQSNYHAATGCHGLAYKNIPPSKD